MRKHNVKFATRWSRTRDADGKLDRSNFPQSMAHSFVNDKRSQYAANSVLRALMTRVLPKASTSRDLNPIAI